MRGGQHSENGGGEWMAYGILVLDCSAVCHAEQINWQIRQVQVTPMFCAEHYHMVMMAGRQDIGIGGGGRAVVAEAAWQWQCLHEGGGSSAEAAARRQQQRGGSRVVLVAEQG
jgi:hypothetical protein